MPATRRPRSSHNGVPIRTVNSPAQNQAQNAIIEEEWLYKGDRDRPEKSRCTYASVACAEVGPFISSQAIGKYFSNRAAAENGRPRATQKTPQQLAILEESFRNDPYPTAGESILLVHETGLTARQVKDWFQHQRDKFPADLVTHNGPTDMNTAGRMWRAYKADPQGYVDKLYSGQISHVTGEESAIPVGAPMGIEGPGIVGPVNGDNGEFQSAPSQILPPEMGYPTMGDGHPHDDLAPGPPPPPQDHPYY